MPQGTAGNSVSKEKICVSTRSTMTLTARNGIVLRGVTVQSKGEVIVYIVGWICGAAVLIAVIAAFYFGTTGPDGDAANDLKRYETCIAAGGSYIEGTSSSAELCIVNGEAKVTEELPK